MKTEERKITIRIIEPEAGHTLTQAADTEVHSRIFSKRIYLGAGADPANWKEITDAEADALRAEADATPNPNIPAHDAEPNN